MQNARLRYAIGAIIALALCIWVVAIGVVVVDTVVVPPATPTQRVRLDPSFTPILTPTRLPTSTPIIPTVTPPDSTLPPTLPATEIAILPTEEPATQAATASTGCAIPAGWAAYQVEDGDTLFGFVLGSKGQLTVESIMEGNCLTSKLLSIGQTVFLPPGVAEKSPKVDDSAPDTSSSASGSRVARCPCVIELRPGLRLEQIAAAVDRVPVGFTGAAFLAAVKGGAPAMGILSTLPPGKSLEGFMFPGTYTLKNDTGPAQFRDMLLNAFAANVGEQIQADAAARGLSFWQVIVLASIIQRESGAPSEQKLIASVFYNRLKSNRGLAATVTLQYALGGPGNWWPRVRTVNLDTPYNTHIYAGLPPSPIANPGLDAILAAVYPAETNYLYFAGKCGGGGNFYASSFAEFEKGLKCN